MNKIRRRARAVGLAALLCAGIVAGGCELRGSSTERQTILVAGLYRAANGGRIVDRNSGAAVRSLLLRQWGETIEGLDNNGRVFRGSFVAESDWRGALNLRGDTTTGAPVTISGTIAVTGNKAVLQGAWIEPGLLGTIAAEADIVTPPNPNPTPTNTTVNVGP